MNHLYNKNLWRSEFIVFKKKKPSEIARIFVVN